MPRPLVIGNGKILLTFDRNLNIRDFYFPYVGLFNHLNGSKIRMGVWVEGRFAWLEEGGWRRELRYLDDTLITEITCEHPGLAVRLVMNDLVYHRANIYLKRVQVFNLEPRAREIRLFFSHDFSIMESDIGDTAFYSPHAGAVIHYKLNHYFLISGYTLYGGLSQFTTGIKGFGNYEGTWRDAEDGQLAGNAIQQGSVDSTIGFHLPVGARDREMLWYWIACGHSLADVMRQNRAVQEEGLEGIFRDTRNYWRAWVHKSEEALAILPAPIAGFCKRSLLIMRTHVDDRGAVIAATDSDILQTAKAHYCYMWPRDGAFIVDALDELRYAITGRRFFEFCARILPPERATLMHKYSADGSMGASWHPWYIEGHAEIPFQEDGSALVLWALWRHYARYEDIEFVEPLYEQLIVPMAEFMINYRHLETGLPLPSWDLWEERRGVHAFTVACVWAGLHAAANFAHLLGDMREQVFEEAAAQIKRAFKRYFYDPGRGYFLRTLYQTREGDYHPDYTPDSSTLIIPLLEMYPPDDQAVQSNVATLEKRLWVPTEVGGMARYEGDYYFRQTDRVPGNPWFVCTLWFAEYLIRAAKRLPDLDRPRELLEWCIRWALPTGVLAEQIHPFTGEPLSVAPLTWSHAAFVHTALLYARKFEYLRGRKGK